MHAAMLANGMSSKTFEIFQTPYQWYLFPVPNFWDFLMPAETPVVWPPHAKSWLIGKDSDAGRDWGQEAKGTTEDEMAGWHHRLYGHEFEWTPGVVMDRRPGVLWLMGSQRVGHDWATEPKWLMMLSTFLCVYWPLLYLLWGKAFSDWKTFFFFKKCHFKLNAQITSICYHIFLSSEFSWRGPRDSVLACERRVELLSRVPADIMVPPHQRLTTCLQTCLT